MSLSGIRPRGLKLLKRSVNSLNAANVHRTEIVWKVRHDEPTVATLAQLVVDLKRLERPIEIGYNELHFFETLQTHVNDGVVLDRR